VKSLATAPCLGDWRAFLALFLPFWSIAAMLIFHVCNGQSIASTENAMKFRMDKTLRFWVECSYEDERHENANRTRAGLIADILREYERHGDAMRYLSVKGKIAWKASPAMLQKLADAEREVEDDMADFP
jgi:hypothetical protein